MKRREFLKCCALGAVTLSAGSWVRCGGGNSYRGVQLSLSIEAATVETIDGKTVFMWVFSSPETGPHFPGPIIAAEEGERIELTITNALDEEHAFSIPDVVESGPIAPGKTRRVNFLAPAAGTYLYFDPLNAPVNRVLGLHGALIVLPEGSTRIPYSAPTPSVQSLFDDLGTTPQFPGEAWQPDRSRIWLFSQIDPAFNAIAANGARIDPTKLVDAFTPRYFTINGRSGAFASHDPSIFPSGRIGQPHLIRILNAGLATHSPHIHGNHVYLVSLNNEIQENVLSIDTFNVAPLDRVDWLLPFVRPPDIAGDPSVPLRTLIPNELALVLGDVPQTPIAYPMHCHMEQSQTAAGGNYPQGLVTHWEILGDLDGIDFPNPQHHLTSSGQKGSKV